jgi:hypothetical protein
MTMLKKLILDVALCAGWFFVSLFIGAVVAPQSSGCVTCGSTIALTIWGLGIAALQPIIWISTPGALSRFIIWLLSLLVGGFIWLSVELVAAMTGYLSLGFVANDMGVIACLIMSVFLVRRMHRKASNQVQEVLAK